MSIRLLQLAKGNDRRLALVDDPHLHLIHGFNSVYEIALAAIANQTPLSELAAARAAGPTLNYDDVYSGASDWRILPSADHPTEPARCFISGTGLTHMASAARRNAMHVATAELTDSMKMFRWGVEGGKPAPGIEGTSPEWFYKGDGSILRACGESLTVPWHGEDGGEEPEIAGVYIISPDGQPFRIGFTIGNEFSDHKFEKRNYLYLASSKLRQCAIGPELSIGAPFAAVNGNVSVHRGDTTLWQSAIATGEDNMCHSVANMEHHHFKFAQHRRPGDMHIHFYGADAFSFGDAIELTTGDTMRVAFEGFGRPLINSVTVEPKSTVPLQLAALT